MKSLLLILGIVLFNTISFGQNLSGLWKGTLNQSKQSFNFELELIKTDSTSYNCISTINIGKEYGIMTAKCSFINGTLMFEEKRILQDKSSTNEWCLKTGKLVYKVLKSETRLSGTWEGHCVPGTIKLSKAKSLVCGTSKSKKTSKISLPVINGDFEHGYFGFNTDHKIASKPGPEQFQILKDAKEFNPLYFTGKGEGCFMAIDGSENQIKLIWGQKVSFDQVEKAHLLAFDISNLNINPVEKNNCSLQITANDKVIGTVHCPSLNNVWETVDFKFIPEKSKVEFKIINLTKGFIGNDFGIDNISIKQLEKESAYEFEKSAKIENEKLARIKQQIDTIFGKFDNTPGFAIGVYSKGEVLLEKGYGIANLDYDIKITPQTVFEIGSIAKQFTAACIVLLENENKLSFDDDIRIYLPEMHEFIEGKITIRNLLHHTGGLRDYLTLIYLSETDINDHYTQQMGLDLLIKQKELNFEPGTKFMYSNSGYLLLASIVERITGESLGTFAQKNIFKPLDMKSTFFYEDKNKVVKNRAIGYHKSGDTYKRDHFMNFVTVGDGQLYTTVGDFHKWNENFKNNELGNDSFLDQMLTKGVLKNGDTLHYALGLEHGSYKGNKTIAHGGSWAGFRSFYIQYPEDELEIIIMANYARANEWVKTMVISDLFLEDKTEKPTKKIIDPKKEMEHMKTPATEFSLKQIVGEYKMAPGYVCSLTLKDDTLNVLQRYNHSTYNILRTIGNTFKISGVDHLPFTFSNPKNKKAQTMSVFENGNDVIWNRMEKLDTLAIKLNDYIGRYYNEELEVTYKFEIKDDVLTFNIEGKKVEIWKCTISDIEEFTFEFGSIKFERKKGKVIGFKLDASRRVIDLKFVKM
jgi:CubicO group peptidase (beta-lactamase class C family)